MKRKDKLEGKQVNNRLLKLASSRAKFVLLLMALTFLCISAPAQENTAQGWYKKGQDMDMNGSHNESVQAYHKALNLTNETLKKNPKDVEAWQTRGLVLESLNRTDEAAKAFDKAIELNPKYVDAWHHKGKALDSMAYRLQGQERIKTFEDAIKAYDKAIEINPKYGDTWKDKGYSLDALATFNKNLNKHNESLEAFDKAIKLIPANDTRNLALAWEGKALALTSTANALADMAGSKREEAIKSYEKAIELDPEFTGLEAQLNRAGVLADLGKYNESIAAFDKAIEAKPANPPGNDPMFIAIILADKGSVLEKMGEHAEALKAFDRALELNPSDPIAMQGRGNALMALGRQPEADAAFAKAKELGYNTSNAVQEKMADYWLEKGHVLERNGSYEEAVQAYDRAIDLEPNNATLYIAKVPSLNVLATIINDQSKLNESMENVNKALQIDPKNPNAWELKGEVFSEMKRYNESLGAYDKAIENISSYRQDSHLNQTEF